MDKTETAQPDSSIQTAATTDTAGADETSQTASGTDRAMAASEVLQRYLKAQATQISRLATSLNQYRQDVQKLEVSLIARIGDVDDDRRHAATRLQRTLQTQRDDLDERLKRHGSLMAILLLLFSLLVAGTLVFFMFRLNATQDALETQMSDLRGALERIEAPARSEPDSQTRAQLDRLSAALAGISKSIERLNEEAATAPLDLNLDLEPESSDSSVATPPEPTPLPQTEPEPASDPEPEPIPESEPAPDLVSTPETGRPLESQPEPEPSTPTEPEPLEPAPVASESPAPSMTTEVTPSEPALPDAPEIAPEPDQEPAPATETETETPSTSAAPDSGDPAQPAVRAPSLATAKVQVGERPFTVQLIGFQTLEALERFAAESVLPMVYYYRQETYQGRPWFVLIHSLHETREGAEAVAAKLPPALAALNIWIRQLRPETELIEVRRLGS